MSDVRINQGSHFASSPSSALFSKCKFPNQTSMAADKRTALPPSVASVANLFR